MQLTQLLRPGLVLLALLSGCHGHGRWHGVGGPTVDDLETPAGAHDGYEVVMPCGDNRRAVSVRAHGHQRLPAKALIDSPAIIVDIDGRLSDWRLGNGCFGSTPTPWVVYADIIALDEAISRYGAWLRDHDYDGEIVLLYEAPSTPVLL